MNSNPKFPTFASGYCHILPDKIVLTETDKLDNPPDNGYPYLFTSTKVIFAVNGIFLTYLGIDFLLKGDIIEGLAFIFGGCISLINFFYIFSHSGHRIIPRRDITKITFKKRVKFWRSATMIISFKNKKGNNRKRLVAISQYEELENIKDLLKREELI